MAPLCGLLHKFKPIIFISYSAAYWLFDGRVSMILEKLLQLFGEKLLKLQSTLGTSYSMQFSALMIIDTVPT